MPYLVSVLTVSVFVLLQSTVLHVIAINGVIPDLSLIAIVYLANKNGRTFGETLGFAAGIVEDLLSLAPLGFHAFLKTTIGFLFGYTRGVVFLDSVLMPVLLTTIATIIKLLLVSILGIFIQLPSLAHAFFSTQTLIEIGYTLLLSPFIFAFLGLFHVFLPRSH
jgi:rod shape-determining protein MreD